jgi:hypothetical protein
MVIYDLDFVGVPVLPAKDYTPLIIDPYRMKSSPVSSQCFQSIARRFTKISEFCCIVQVEQLSPRHPD